MGRIVEVVDISFDKKKNCLVVILDNGDKIEIDPIKITENMPKLNIKERVKDLQMMIHYIDRQQLSKISHIFSKVPEFDKGIQDAREKLKDCKKMPCVKKWQAVSKTYVDEKNNLRELRLSINLLGKRKAELRTQIAKLGFDPDEEETE